MTAPVVCHRARHEAMGYGDATAAVLELTDAQWAEVDAAVRERPDCGWDGPLKPGGRGCGGGYCWCRYTVLLDVCPLPDGHAGPHEWAPVEAWHEPEGEGGPLRSGRAARSQEAG
jgi:hypothetical protein